MTITIESTNVTPINSILYLLKGNNNSKVEIKADDEKEVSEGLDFYKFDLKTQQSLLKSVEDYRNGNRERFISFEKNSILTHFASENVLAKDWLTEIEDEAWKDL